MIYGLNSQELGAAWGLGGSLDAAYGLDGSQVWVKEQEQGGDDAKQWSGVKWVAIGDSLSDMTLNGTTAQPSDRKYQKILADKLEGIEVVNKYSGGNFAVGGRGYWCGGSTNFHGMSGHVPSDATIITVFGSVNDWKYRSIDTSRNTLAKHSNVSGSSSHPKWLGDPHLDTVADGTLAGYVNETIARLHAAAPNAKVVVIPGVSYCIANSTVSPYMLSAYFVYQAVVRSWIDNVEGAGEWLRFESWFYDACLEREAVDGEDYGTRYWRALGDDGKPLPHYIRDWRILDDWKGNEGGVFDSRLLRSAWGAHYAYDYKEPGETATQVSFGHWENEYHRKFLAVKFAHVLLDAMGWDESVLPESLRYNNPEGETELYTV